MYSWHRHASVTDPVCMSKPWSKPRSHLSPISSHVVMSHHVSLLTPHSSRHRYDHSSLTTHTHACTRTHTHTHACAHTHTHTRTRTHTHTHTRTHLTGMNASYNKRTMTLIVSIVGCIVTGAFSAAAIETWLKVCVGRRHG